MILRPILKISSRCFPYIVACLVSSLPVHALEPTAAVEAPTPPGIQNVEVAASSPGSDLRITEDVTWKGQVQLEGGVTVAPQATLTIEPGTEVKVASGASTPALVVHGRLVAVGTADKPVVFGSEGGDGKWQGIFFIGSEKKNIMEYCRISGADSGIDGAFSTITLKNTSVSGGGIHCSDCLISIVGGSIQQSKIGIRTEESEVDLKEVTVTGNHTGVSCLNSSLRMQNSLLQKNDSTGLVTEGSRLHLAHNRILDNGGSGMTLAASEGTCSGNTISDNRGDGIQLRNARLKISGNLIQRNGMNGIQTDTGKSVAWGNVIAGNGGYECLNSGPDDVKMIGNWWGNNNAAEVSKRIYDRRVDPSRGIVKFIPLLVQAP